MWMFNMLAFIYPLCECDVKSKRKNRFTEYRIRNVIYTFVDYKIM